MIVDSLKKAGICDIANNKGNTIVNRADKNLKKKSVQITSISKNQGNSAELTTKQALDLARQHHIKGRLDGATNIYQEILRLNPDNLTALHSFSAFAYQTRKYDIAIDLIEKAISINPNDARSYNNLGSAFKKLGALDDAKVSYQKAVTIKPYYADAHSNLGVILNEQGKLEEAAASYQKAIDIKPDYAEARFNLGVLHLLRGDFETGWEGYAWRWRRVERSDSLRDYDAPQWNGEPLENKHIFIYHEQGFGDHIQFVRYVSALHKKGARITLEAPVALNRLLQCLNNIVTLITPGDTPSEFDYHVPILELPKLFGTTLNTIPQDHSYLQADTVLVKEWAKRLGPKKDFRVGIVWAGKPTHKNDKNRSIDPQLFQSLSAVPGVSFYSLQLGRNDEATRIINPNINDLAPHINDFADTAAIMSNLDLVITVDSAVAHVAGALGIPVWTLLPYIPDWRWLLDRDDSPWYPTMQLFRQKNAGNWSEVMERVISALKLIRDTQTKEKN